MKERTEKQWTWRSWRTPPQIRSGTLPSHYLKPKKSRVQMSFCKNYSKEVLNKLAAFFQWEPLPSALSLPVSPLRSPLCPANLEICLLICVNVSGIKRAQAGNLFYQFVSKTCFCQRLHVGDQFINPCWGSSELANIQLFLNELRLKTTHQNLEWFATVCGWVQAQKHTTVTMCGTIFNCVSLNPNSKCLTNYSTACNWQS